MELFVMSIATLGGVFYLIPLNKTRGNTKSDFQWWNFSQIQQFTTEHFNLVLFNDQGHWTNHVSAAERVVAYEQGRGGGEGVFF